jgi:hypothetical protein
MYYPRLLIPRIAVWRTPHDLHLGGPDSPVILTGVPSEVPALVELLDGRHSVEELSAAATPRWTNWLLAVLVERGLLADGPLVPAPLSVEVAGTGTLAKRLTALLTASRIPAGDRLPRGRSATLTIVASESVEADRVLVTDLQTRHQPHLVVRATEASASVGPFVIPGTSCLTCADLARRALDPTWPFQVFQLARVVSQPGPALGVWASSTAVNHVLAYAHGLTPESASTTIEMSGYDGRLTYRAWPINPDCPHHAQPVESVEDDLPVRGHPQRRHGGQEEPAVPRLQQA